MKLLFFFLIIISNLSAIDKLELNFFVEPHFEAMDTESNGARIFKYTQNDTIPYYNFFAGQIFAKTHNDSLLLDNMNYLNCDYCTPTDYNFSKSKVKTDYKFLVSNIKNRSKNIIPWEIILTDSMKIGVFALYSPDFAVKNKLAPEVNFDHDIFKTAAKIYRKLRKKTDFIIMLSNLTKYVDEDLVNKVPVDVVISFDYQAKKNELLENKHTFWYGIKTFKRKFGRLQLTYHKGKITYHWKKVRLGK